MIAAVTEVRVGHDTLAVCLSLPAVGSAAQAAVNLAAQQVYFLRVSLVAYPAALHSFLDTVELFTVYQRRIYVVTHYPLGFVLELAAVVRNGLRNSPVVNAYTDVFLVPEYIVHAGAGERLSHLGAESTGFQLCEYVGIFLPFVCHAENQPDSVRLVFVYPYLHGFRVNTVAKWRHSSRMLAVVGIFFQRASVRLFLHRITYSQRYNIPLWGAALRANMRLNKPKRSV